jgi:hypothetical protein
MNQNQRKGIVGGVIFVLLGLLFLASELLPQTFAFWEWPFIIIGLGGVFLLWAILAGTGGLAVPGAILTGIGGILYYQNLTGDWASWSYIWALIPGFVGLGVIISGIIDGNIKEAFTGGLTLLMISGVLFFAFGSALGLEHELIQYWPVLLIVLGLIALVRVIFSQNNRRSKP